MSRSRRARALLAATVAATAMVVVTAPAPQASAATSKAATRKTATTRKTTTTKRRAVPKRKPAAKTPAAARPTTPAATPDSATPTPTPAPGIDKPTLGASFGPCPGSAIAGVECTVVAAPLNPADPAGPSIGLFVSRRKATDSTNRLGVLFVNPGGPGGPAFDLVRNATLFSDPEVLARFDIVGVDPRGTERSQPITCSVDGRSALEQQGSVQETLARMSRVCADVEGARLDYLDTPTAAADLDAVRQALGEDRISFLGMSYGTYLGATYQRLYPSRTARMVLDSAIDPEHFGANLILERAAAYELALDGFLASCANGQLTPCAFNDGTDLRAKFDRTRAAYVARFRNPADGQASFDGLVAQQIGYPRNGWPVIGRALQEVASGARGNFAWTPGDAQFPDTRERALPAGRFSELTNIAVNCRDGILPRESGARQSLIERIPAVAPRFSGLARDWSTSALTCVAWPTSTLSLPTFAPQGIPTLVLANRFDLTTPLQWSDALARRLTAPLLVREGGGHVAIDKSDCVRAAVTRFLIDATPGLANNSCPG